MGIKKPTWFNRVNLIVTAFVLMAIILPAAPTSAQDEDPGNDGSGIVTIYDNGGAAPTAPQVASEETAPVAPASVAVQDDSDDGSYWSKLPLDRMSPEDVASYTLLLGMCPPSFTGLPCVGGADLSRTIDPNLDNLVMRLPMVTLNQSSCISPRDKVKDLTGVDIKQKGTGVTAEACLFAWRGRPDKTWATCPSGFLCTWDLGANVRMFLGKGQRKEVYAGDFAYQAAYSSGSGTNNPCLRLAKLQTYLKSHGINTPPGVDPDSGFTCQFPLPDVSLTAGADPRTPSLPTPAGCVKGKDADDLFGIDVEQEEGFENKCLYFWRGGTNVQPRDARCPVGYQCDMQIVPPSAENATYSVKGNGNWYKVRSVTYRKVDGDYNWCQHVLNLDDYLQRNNKGKARTVGHSCPDHTEANPTPSRAA